MTTSQVSTVIDDPASVDAAIESRFSARAFLQKPVPRETIEAILQLARRAPSGTNTQPWKVHVLQGATLAAVSGEVCAAMPLDQGARKADQIFGLRPKKPDGLDMLADGILSQGQHFFRCSGNCEKSRRRPVHAGVGCLRRQHHRDQQGKRIGRLQLALGLRDGSGKTPEYFRDLG